MTERGKREREKSRKRLFPRSLLPRSVLDLHYCFVNVNVPIV